MKALHKPALLLVAVMVGDEAVAVTAGPAQSCPDILDMSKEIDPSATLYYARVPSNPRGSDNGLLCGRLEAEHDGWIGLAISKNGQMIGSEAIIGLPGDDTVLKYDMTDKGLGITPMADDKQTLTDTSIEQEGGKAIMKFTKLLLEDGEIPILEEGKTVFLHARGGASLGFHSTYRAFPMDFGTLPEPALSTKDCTKEFCENQLSPEYLLRYRISVPTDTTLDVCDGCTISMELIYDGEAWVSIAFSTNGAMVGGEAVIGMPGEGTVQKYTMDAKSKNGVQPMSESQQTLSETSVEVVDGRTIMKFTKIMKEAGEIEVFTGDNTFLWAHGSRLNLGYHAERASFELNLSSGTSEGLSVPNKAAWLAHGIMGFLAWGVFVPFAVQSALLRHLLPKGPIWFKLHRAFNTTAYAFFIVIFAIAVAYTSKEGGTHFGNGHQKMGLAMFIMAFFQVFGGIIRPHVPSPNSGEEKTPVRKGWEVGHRVLGVALLACGFWQMGEGIELYADKYSVSESAEDNLNIAYWVWIGLMSALISVGGGYFKFKNVSPKDTNNDEMLVGDDDKNTSPKDISNQEHESKGHQQ